MRDVTFTSCLLRKLTGLMQGFRLSKLGTPLWGWYELIRAIHNLHLFPKCSLHPFPWREVLGLYEQCFFFKSTWLIGHQILAFSWDASMFKLSPSPHPLFFGPGRKKAHRGGTAHNESLPPSTESAVGLCVQTTGRKPEAQSTVGTWWKHRGSQSASFCGE